MPPPEPPPATQSSPAPNREQQLIRAARQAADAAPPLDDPGRIGPYELRETLGEGGMGTVFLAEQTEPVRRRVALKLIKLGMDTRQVIARFESERQALAMMSHPNIATVLDAGATEGGRPYFVMEYVPGEPITDYCDKNKLNISQRLDLFINVCQAVQHAHTKAIIHRDLKPSNVLVMLQDGRPVPKVIDFGLAKAVNQRLTEHTLFTAHGQTMGTPEYMSPEQAEMGMLDIDTRTDVYSLGVLLYELLSGTLPFDQKTLRGAAFAEMQRIIREVEPPRPSTRLSALSAVKSADRGVESRSAPGAPGLDPLAPGPLSSDIAASRQTDPQTLVRTLRGDLDWIVMKCIEKDRTRRYETPSALAMEIRRYLNHEPVLAGPPTTAYRLRKFVRRNRGAVVAASLMGLTLIGGLAGTTWGVFWALGERDKARLAREDAERQQKKTQQIADFQASQFRNIDPQRMGVRMRANLLAEAEATMQESKLNPAEAKSGRARLEGLLAGLNLTNVVLKLLDQDIFEHALQAAHDRFADQPVVQAQLLHRLAETLADLGLLDRAMALQQEASAIYRRVLGDAHRSTLTALNNLGDFLQRQGKLADAEQCIREVLQKCRRALGDDDELTLTACTVMGNVLQSQGRLDEAERYYREALPKMRRLLGEGDPKTLSTTSNMGLLMETQGRWVEAEAYYREAMEKGRRFLGDEHPDSLNSIGNLGGLLQRQGRLEDAATYLREALEKSRHALGDEHDATLNRMNLMAGLLRALGKLDEAEPLLREALEKRRRILGNDHPETIRSICNLGVVLKDEGKLEEAAPYYKTALEKMRRVFGEEHPETLRSINNLGVLLRAQGELVEAERYLRDALEKRRRALGRRHPDTLRSMITLAVFLQLEDRLDEAEPYQREALANARKRFGPDAPDTIDAISGMGTLRMRQYRLEEAEVYLCEAVANRRRVLGNDHPATLEAERNLAELERCRSAASLPASQASF